MNQFLLYFIHNLSKPKTKQKPLFIVPEMAIEITNIVESNQITRTGT